VAKKKTALSRKDATKKRSSAKKSAPAKKAATPLKGAKAPKAALGRARAQLLSEAIPPQCPTHVYDGEVILDDANRTSFLRTTGGTYLMLLDPDCSGTFTAGRVDAAYGAFSQNPGRNQRLVCNGFLHEDGTAQVLHVLS
jgi:hypothetical protein